MVETAERLPVVARAVNRLGRPLRSLIRLDPDALRAAAERRAGLADWGDEPVEPMLSLLCRSVEEDVRPHFIGRVLVREMLVGNLANRLRLVDGRKRRPQALEVPVRSPLVIASMPRTGTTVLQRLLCQDPTAIWLPLWLALDPLPAPRPDQWRRGDLRRNKARLGSSLLRWMVPDIHHKHWAYADDPEECVWLFMVSLQSFQFWTLWPVLQYADWVAEADAHGPYRMYRQILQLLQVDHPGTHWVLKSPMHFLTLRALLDELPEAKVVLLHRDPVKAIPSLHSLFDSTQRAVTTERDRDVCTRVTHREMVRAARDVAALRDGPHAERILDLDFHDLVADPIAVAQRVQAWSGHPWTPDLDAGARRWLAENPRNAHGAHRYSLEDYGLSEQGVREDFAEYRERFGLR